MNSDPRPLIITALFESGVQARLEALRRAHFPPDRNQVPAHLTLFHALPGSAADEVLHRVRSACAVTPPPPATLADLRFTGAGVAVAVTAPALELLRADLADQWHGLLTAQDRQGWRPHVTIQNKAAGDTARATFAALAAGFRPVATHVHALAVWRYDGGPWHPVASAAFRGR